MAHLGLTGDFKMPNRADLMSLSTINNKMDQQATSTAKFNTIRNTSNNLNTNDIQGKCVVFLNRTEISNQFERI